MPSSFFDGAWGGHVFERISGAAKSRGQEKQSSSCRTRLAARGSANPPGGDPKRGSALRSDRRELSQAVTRFARTRRAFDFESSVSIQTNLRGIFFSSGSPPWQPISRK